jgi:PAS domain S-box-containing protein
MKQGDGQSRRLKQIEVSFARGATMGGSPFRRSRWLGGLEIEIGLSIAAIVEAVALAIGLRQGQFGLAIAHLLALALLAMIYVWIRREFRDRQAENRQQLKSEEQNRSVVDHVLDGIMTIDDAGIVVSINPAAQRIFGYAPPEIIGRNIKELMQHKQHEEHEYLMNYLRTGQTNVIGVGREIGGRRKDGTAFAMHFAISALSASEFPLFTCIVRDISQSKLYEEQLRSQSAQLQEIADRLLAADQRKNEFLAMLAHELRTPLASIQHLVDSLQLMNLTDPRLQELRDVLQRQVEQVSRLVEDIMDASRLARGKVRIRKEKTDIAAVLQRAIETCRPMLDERRHELVTKLPDEPIPLDADPTRLAQVFSNLLTNAIKYSPQNSRIEMSAAREDGRAVVRVRDFGVGIAPEMLGRIFDLFTQGNVSPDRAQGGLGIGLTTARSLVEMHGGVIQALSEGPGKGSEFIVRLPIAEPEALAAAPAKEPAASSAAGPQRRVLLVDDNRDAARSLSMLLQMEGHEVTVAFDGPSALKAAEANPPDVVLLDIGLPGMDGLEVARRLRESSHRPDLVLIALTGYGQDDDVRRSLDAGFNAHVIKPVKLETLNKLIANSDLTKAPAQGG